MLQLWNSDGLQEVMEWKDYRNINIACTFIFLILD